MQAPRFGAHKLHQLEQLPNPIRQRQQQSDKTSKHGCPTLATRQVTVTHRARVGQIYTPGLVTNSPLLCCWLTESEIFTPHSTSRQNLFGLNQNQNRCRAPRVPNCNWTRVYVGESREVSVSSWPKHFVQRLMGAGGLFKCKFQHLSWPSKTTIRLRVGIL